MRRIAAVLALLALAGAGAWIVLRDGAAEHERPAAPAPTIPGTPGARPGAELAAPAAVPSSPSGAPPAERVALGGAVAAEAEIRDAEGAPVRSAGWALFRGEEVLASGVTTSDGIARFARGTGAAELAVRPAQHPLQRFPCDLALEHQMFTLDAGAAVAGFVTVDGFPPDPPLGLTLRCGAPLASVEVPLKVWTAMGGEPQEVERLMTRTGPDGVFRFDGLPADWSGSLSWSGDVYRPREAGAPRDLTGIQGLSLAAPAEDLRLALTTGAQLTGTVVDPLTGAGIPATVYASFHLGDQSQGVHGPSDEHGRLAYSFPDELPEHVELRVSMIGGAGMRTYAFDLPRDVKTYDLGPLAVYATRAVAFVVRDGSGRPIAGAQATSVPAPPEGTPIALSDAAGSGHLFVPLGVQGLRVAASGYEPAEVALPPGDEPVLVVLSSGTVLEVRLAPAVPGLALELRGSEPPFLLNGEPSWRPETWHGPMGLTWDGEQGSVGFYDDKDGVYELSGVRPGAALALSVLDRYRTPVGEASVAPLSPGEHRVVDLALAVEPRALAGQVLSAGREPVAGARVRAGPVGSSQGSGTKTGADGHFRCDDLCAQRVRLTVEAPGYTTLLIPDQPVTGEHLELVLEAGRAVRVTVVGPGGDPVPCEPPASEVWVKAETEAGTVSSTSKSAGPGVFLLEHAPSTACTLLVTAGGRDFEQPLPAGRAAVRVELPAWQACTVEVPGWADLPSDDGSYVVLRALDADPPRTFTQARSTPTDQDARFDVVFPGRYEAYVGARGQIVGENERRLSDVQVLEIVPGAPAQATLKLEAP